MTEYGIVPQAYRLPEETRVGVVRLQVGDLARSLDWYTRVLGFQAMPSTGDSGAAGARLAAADGTVLIELVERPGARPVDRHGRLGLFHFALLLPDRAALGRFVTHVASLAERIGASDHRVSEALYLYDPDGLGVEVYADRPRERWRHRDRQVEMTTDPLDLQAVAAEGGGEPWKELPAGATVGHMHLHVGDLGVAEAFYHGRLGLDKMVWAYPGALFLAAGGYHHHLGVNTWAAGASPPAPDEARLLEWELVVPTPEDARAALASVGGDPDTGLVADPWGTVLRVRPDAPV